MTETDETHGLELMQRGDRPGNLADALVHPLFEGGTVDVFIDQEHYRVCGCTARYDGNKLELLGDSESRLRIMCDRVGRHASRDFEFEMARTAYAVLMHGTAGKALFFSFMQGRSSHGDVQVVLYPKGREPSDTTLHIVGWSSPTDPVFNGAYTPHKAS